MYRIGGVNVGGAGTSAGLLLESFARLRAVDPGVRPDGVVTMEVHLPNALYQDLAIRYDTREKQWQFYGGMLERVRALPGVIAAGVSVSIPFRGGDGCTVQGFEDANVYARLDDAGLTTCAAQLPTSPGYFQALGIPLLAGRSFTDRDNDVPETRAAIVSSAFAERFWPGEDPIGKGVAPNGFDRDPFYRVVGVVGDVYSSSVLEEPALAIYYPVVPAEGSGGWSGTPNLVVRSSLADPTSLFPAIRRVVHELDAAIPLANLEEMRSVVARSMSRQSFTLVLLAPAAALLAAVAALASWLPARRASAVDPIMALRQE